MNRITDKNLEALCARLNESTGSPLEAYSKQPDGTYKANVGNFHLDHAYGGVTLHRMSNESGGVSNVLSCGYVPKRELYDLMQAFLRGLEFHKH